MSEMKESGLHTIAKIFLFLTSYTPLFFLIALKQLFLNHEYLVWGGIISESLSLWWKYFSFSTVLLSLTAFGFIGLFFLFKNIEKNSKNGDHVIVRKVNNKNSESMGYIATYIIPFLNIDFSSAYEIISLGVLLLIICNIYKPYRNKSNIKFQILNIRN